MVKEIIIAIKKGCHNQRAAFSLVSVDFYFPLASIPLLRNLMKFSTERS